MYEVTYTVLRRHYAAYIIRDDSTDLVPYKFYSEQVLYISVV